MYPLGDIQERQQNFEEFALLLQKEEKGSIKYPDFGTAYVSGQLTQGYQF